MAVIILEGSLGEVTSCMWKGRWDLEASEQPASPGRKLPAAQEREWKAPGVAALEQGWIRGQPQAGNCQPRLQGF